MPGLRQLACDVWVLTKGYWGSEERWSARLLLASVIGLNLGLVGVNVRAERGELARSSPLFSSRTLPASIAPLRSSSC